jgi:hypothetical protein
LTLRKDGKSFSCLSQGKLVWRKLHAPLSHPLVEQWADLFVPNDTHAVGGSVVYSQAEGRSNGASDADMNTGAQGAASVVICTGANACGKVSSKYDLISSVLWLRIVSFQECLFEAGTVLMIKQLPCSILFTCFQNTLIPFMAQVC